MVVNIAYPYRPWTMDYGPWSAVYTPISRETTNYHFQVVYSDIDFLQQQVIP